MNTAGKNHNIDLCSLGEELLTSFIEKGRDSVLSKDEANTDSQQNEYPAFFKMLNIDASECDEKWIVDFNQATNNASEEEIKKFGKPAIDMLSSIIYFLLSKNKSEKKQENYQIDDKYKNEHLKNQSNSKIDSKICYYYDEDFANNEILRELTEGLDPKYLDPDFNMIHSATIKQNDFDSYSLLRNESRIYKTQDNNH